MTPVTPGPVVWLCRGNLSGIPVETTGGNEMTGESWGIYHVHKLLRLACHCTSSIR